MDDGPEGLKDRRGGNNRKLTDRDERRIIRNKLEGKHRSARFIRDKLKLKVYQETVRRVLVRHHINRVTLPPVKRFEAKEPNELWQIGIMGRTNFPLIRDLYDIKRQKPTRGDKKRQY